MKMEGKDISKAESLLVISLFWFFTTCLGFGDFDKVYSGVEELAGDPPKVRFAPMLFRAQNRVAI